MSDNNSFISSHNGGQPYSVRELVDILEQVTNQLTMLRKYVASDFKTQTIKIRFYQEHIQLITTNLLLGTSPVDAGNMDITRETETVLEKIHSIASQIQFDDIIRQKLEHMIQINQEIVEDLHRLMKADNAAPVTTPISFLPVVPGMMQCCIAQLNQIREEYQQVFDQIHLQLNGIRKYTDFIASVSANQLKEPKTRLVSGTPYKHCFTFLLRLADQLQVEATASLMQLNSNNAFEPLLKDTIDQLSNIGQKAPVMEQEVVPAKLNATIKHIEKVYTMESERVIYNHVFQTAYPTRETNSTDIELF